MTRQFSQSAQNRNAKGSLKKWMKTSLGRSGWIAETIGDICNLPCRGRIWRFDSRIPVIPTSCYRGWKCSSLRLQLWVKFCKDITKVWSRWFTKMICVLTTPRILQKLGYPCLKTCRLKQASTRANVCDAMITLLEQKRERLLGRREKPKAMQLGNSNLSAKFFFVVRGHSELLSPKESSHH